MTATVVRRAVAGWFDATRLPDLVHAVHARREAAVWHPAATVPELAALTLDWVDGRLRTCPGYVGAADLDPVVVPGVRRLLAAGWWSTSSQGSACRSGEKRRAYVGGLAEPGADSSILSELVAAGCRWSWTPMPLVPVTWWRGRVVTVAGAGEERETLAEGLSPAGAAAVWAARSWVAWDETPGRGLLWEVLGGLACSAEITSGSCIRIPDGA